MAVTIQIKRGQKAGLPALAVGEWGFATDTEEVFIGNSDGNVQLSTLQDGGAIPISQGGTGATSASGALSNLGAAPQSAVTSLTQQVEQALSDATSALSAATAALPKSGGTLTGSVVAMTSPAEGTAQIRNAVVVASTVTDEEIESLSVPAGTIVFREE